ncbi:MAG: complex I NDUFA9 subunit family protein [Burkholderiaceae bacterium]|nr:complex I NDUFA9 subunit family protein [Burkholderiaceae bacterium]
MLHADVVIVGGSGFIGRALAAALISRDKSVRIITRKRERSRELWPLPKIEIVEADPHDEAALYQAFENADAVVNLVGALHSKAGKPWGPDFDAAHVKLPARIARCMNRRKIRRLIHISALGAAEQAPSMYLRSKAAGEAALRANQSIDVTILRPSVVFGAEDQFMNLFAKLQKLLPVVPLATPHARFQPIAVTDLANAIANCLDNPTTIGKNYECVGPEVLTLYELVHWAGVYAGCPRPIIPLPDGAAWMQAWVMENLPGKPMMSRDNLASASVPNVGSAPMSPDLGIPNPLSIHAIVPTYLGKETPRARLSDRRAKT